MIALPGVDADEALALAAALEQQVRHPFSRAFADITPAPGVDNVQPIPGQGVSGRRGNRAIAIGSPAFAAEFCSTALTPPPLPGHWIALADQDRPLAWFAVDDQPRAEAAEVVRGLQARGLEVELLTGDSSDAGRALAVELDIGTVHTGASPDAKLARIRQLQASGEIVTMVGDGLNDAPVLAAANCSFAVNEATDLAKSRADGILVNPALTPLLLAFTVADRSRRIIRQNMAWAIGYNGLAVPLAAAGMIPPWLAAIGMSLSSLLVVLNSLRLK
jgi:Cu2+-exporting ATPase